MMIMDSSIEAKYNGNTVADFALKDDLDTLKVCYSEGYKFDERCLINACRNGYVSIVKWALKEVDCKGVIHFSYYKCIIAAIEGKHHNILEEIYAFSHELTIHFLLSCIKNDSINCFRFILRDPQTVELITQEIINSIIISCLTHDRVEILWCLREHLPLLLEKAPIGKFFQDSIEKEDYRVFEILLNISTNSQLFRDVHLNLLFEKNRLFMLKRFRVECVKRHIDYYFTDEILTVIGQYANVEVLKWLKFESLIRDKEWICILEESISSIKSFSPDRRPDYETFENICWLKNIITNL